ncbi:MAG: sulfur carrier protein ThiS [Marinilabiliaceae bacterium]|nr:sulfur carrier protein ThiS [Bacteroidales bacterium]MDD5815470.1 sulfur carrier protein ThiS [Bacteroidales bacterium]MDY4521347.1 sulfur carrier protein ThiS [Bacteroidales bacterium]
MNIKVNNEALDFKGKTVADLIAQLGLPAVGVAVAIGTDIVSRDAWQTKELAEGDNVMIIRAASGG